MARLKISSGLKQPAALLAIALLLGRASGFVREMELARIYGVSPIADLAVLLLTFPDLLTNLLLSGGMTAALVPYFRQNRGEKIVSMFWQVLTVTAIVGASIGFGFALYPELFLFMLAPGLQAVTISPSAGLLIGCAVPLAAVTGVVTAMLNARDKFFVAGNATLIFNLTFILALLLSDVSPILSVGVGVALGAATRLISQISVLPKVLWSWPIRRTPLDPGLLTAFAAGTSASAIALAVPLLVRAGASFIAPGSIAQLSYAQKIVELPAGVLISALATIALPHISAAFATQDAGSLQSCILTHLRRAVLLSVCVTPFGMLFVYPFVDVAFGRGAMDEGAIATVATLGAAGLLSLPCLAASAIATAALNAQHRARRVLTVTGLSLVTLPFLLLGPALMGSVIGLVLATSLYQAILAALLTRELGFRFPWLGNKGLFSGRFLAVAAASIIAAAICKILVHGLGIEHRLVALGIGFAGVMVSLCAFWTATRD